MFRSAFDRSLIRDIPNSSKAACHARRIEAVVQKLGIAICLPKCDHAQRTQMYSRQAVRATVHVQAVTCHTDLEIVLADFASCLLSTLTCCRSATAALACGVGH